MELRLDRPHVVVVQGEGCESLSSVRPKLSAIHGSSVVILLECHVVLGLTPLVFTVLIIAKGI